MTTVSTTEGLNDLDFGSEVTEEQINAAIESGDPAVLEALMRGELIAQKTEEPEFPEIKTPEPAKKQDEESAASGAEAGEVSPEVKSEDENIEGDVLAKDGKHLIPNHVLAGARAQAKANAERATALELQLSEAKAQLQIAESSSKSMTKLLKDKGIDPAELTAQQSESITEEDLAEISDLDPLVAKAIRVLQKQSQAPAPQEAPAETSAPLNPARAAINANTDLSAWEKSDPDRWDFAVAVDEKLKADPRFSSLSLSERFAEVARRTRIAYGEDAQPTPEKIPEIIKESAAEVAAKKIAEATARSIPRSLTNLGVSPTTERSLTEVLADLSPEQVAARMANMTPAQMAEVLGGIS